MTFRTRNTPPERVKADTSGESLTKQSFEKAGNINNIMRQHLSGTSALGSLPGNPNAQRKLQFGTMPAQSYHDMLNMVTDVQNVFNRLPSRVRSRFKDVYQLLRWVENPDNIQEAVRLKLIDNPEVVEAVREAEALADAEAMNAGEAAPAGGTAPKPDPEAQPPYGGIARPATKPPNPA